MSIGFLKEYRRHFIDASRTDLSELEKLDLLQRKKNGDTVYQCLYNNIVRENWEDHEGYPLKEKFHSEGYLVCTIPIRRLVRLCDMANQKLQLVLNIREKLNHLIKDKRYTKKGQTVYILGTWRIEKNEDGENVIVEELFRDKARDSYIKQRSQKPKENDYSMYEFGELWLGGIESYFGRP